MMMPRRAASEIAPITATGMAMSNGQGVATTTTARKRWDSTAYCPRHGCKRERDWRVPGSQFIAQPTNMQVAALLRPA